MIWPLSLSWRLLFVVCLFLLKSIKTIGPTEVGLVTKRFGLGKLGDDNPIAFKGEAGYQAKLLMPGLRFKFWPVFGVKKFPWVQVPAGEIGVVIAQVGVPLPIGAKSGVYKPEFGNFSHVEPFITGGGQKGVQRPVLAPGTLLPIHPVAFMVITSRKVYGLPVSPDLVERVRKGGELHAETPSALDSGAAASRAIPSPSGPDRTSSASSPPSKASRLPPGDIASRLGGYDDIAAMEQVEGTVDSQIIDVLLGSKNTLHNNYQDFQAFLDNGGKIGLQHDPLLYGAYLLNPFLVRVDMVPMLVVNQGEVAVVKAYVGLPTLDTSGAEFKFGSIVRPGPPRHLAGAAAPGKYPINPRVYAAEIVPTSILTLNWAEGGVDRAQPRRAPVADRGQEPRGLRVQHRPAGADPRARHPRAEGHLDGRHDAEPRERGAAGRGRQPLPGQAAEHAGDSLHRDPPECRKAFEASPRQAR